MTWYVPSWNGDIRFTSEGDDTLLTVISPTYSERVRLQIMELEFRKRRWIDKALWLGVDPREEIRTTFVRAPLLDVAGFILAAYTPGGAVLTAIRYANDHVTTVEAGQGFWSKMGAALGLSTKRGATEASEIVTASEQIYANDRARAVAEERERLVAAEAAAMEARFRRETEIEAQRKRERIVHERAEREAHARRQRAEEDRQAAQRRAEAEAAARAAAPAVVTVRRPTISCPQCTRAPINPARDVFMAFLTADERAQWEQQRYIVVTGNLTGHRYMLAHRNSEWARRHGKICHDLDDDCTLHFHDWSVPPEEEVLGAKLILQHREHWLRVPGSGVSDYEFDSPFGGDVTDGTRSAKLTREIADAVLGPIDVGCRRKFVAPNPLAT